eukprot:scaffold9685_cov51-Cyclotella_meneghiniana.AAC.7
MALSSNSAGDASPTSPAAGNNSDRSPDDDSRVGSGGPIPGTATVTGDLLEDGDPVDAPSATDGSNGDNPQESGTVRPSAPWAYEEDDYTGPIIGPGEPQPDGWGRRENSAREDPVPDSKPSRPSWVPWGPCDRWIPPYPGTNYWTFVPSDGGPARRKFVDPKFMEEGTEERAEEAKEAGPPSKRSRGS